MSSATAPSGVLHVAVATDEGFAMPTAVTLRSLLTTSDASFHVTVLHDALSADTKQRIERSLPPGRAELSWVDAAGFEIGATRGTHLTVATYFRLWVADAVPATASRVLYLDVDTIVRHDLGDLFATDLQGLPAAAVQSVHYPFVATRGAVNDWRELGLAPDTAFFNAGVLLIDLAAWRAQRVSEQALEYLRSPHLGGGADQEALNVALRGGWAHLPPTMNQQTPLLTDDFGAHLIHSAAEIEAARTDPTIVHFQTRPKPWQRGSTHPWRAEWLEHARKVDFSPIEDERERSLPDEARWRIRRAASALIRGK